MILKPASRLNIHMHRLAHANGALVRDCGYFVEDECCIAFASELAERARVYESGIVPLCSTR
jgi:hypothetical protein